MPHSLMFYAIAGLVVCDSAVGRRHRDEERNHRSSRHIPAIPAFRPLRRVRCARRYTSDAALAERPFDECDFQFDGVPGAKFRGARK